MAKSKYSPALFEVISRQRNTSKLGVPKWWKGLRRAAVAEPAGDPLQVTVPSATRPDASPAFAGSQATMATNDGSDCGPQAQADPESEVSTAASAVSGQTSGRALAVGEQRSKIDAAVQQPIFQVDEGRVWISLNTKQAAIVAGVLLAILILSFGLGRGMRGADNLAAQPTADDVEKTLADSPNPSVLNPLRDKVSTASAKPARAVESPTRTAPPAAEAQLKAGLNYVVFDRYPRDKRGLAVAEHVQKWLATTHNIAAVLRPHKDGYLLLSQAGFDYSVAGEENKCRQLAEQVKGLGKECRNELMRAKLPVYVFASPQVVRITE